MGVYSLHVFSNRMYPFSCSSQSYMGKKGKTGRTIFQNCADRTKHAEIRFSLPTVDGHVPAFQTFFVRETPARGRSLQFLASPAATPTGDPQTRSQPYCWQSRDGRAGTQIGMLR